MRTTRMIRLAGGVAGAMLALAGSALALPGPTTSLPPAANGSPVPAPAPAPVTTAAGADTTPPSAPAGLRASSVTQTQVNLAWATSTDGVVAGQTTSGVSGYQVFRNGTLVGSPSVNSYADAGRTPSTQ